MRIILLWRASCSLLYNLGEQGYMKSPSRVLLGSQSEEFGSFPCMLTSSTPIWVDTKEVGHNHVLHPTLECSIPVGSPVVPGLTSPRALHSRVMQASSASEDVRRVLSRVLGLLFM